MAKLLAQVAAELPPIDQALVRARRRLVRRRVAGRGCGERMSRKAVPGGGQLRGPVHLRACLPLLPGVPREAHTFG